MKVLIGGGPGSNYCLFEFKDSKTIAVSYCLVNNEDLSSDNFIDRILETKETHISSKTVKELANQLKVLSEKAPDKEFTHTVDDATYVWALVEDKAYWSIYDNDYKEKIEYPRYTNEELLDLAYTLIEISPLTVGGEMNPIRLPDD